jgi:hypothetical protein
MEHLKGRYNNLNDLEVVSIHMDNISSLFSLQPILWILGLFKVVMDNRGGYDEVHIGYIMNDSALSYLKDIERIWYSLFNLSFSQNENIPAIRFPLVKMHKSRIISKLQYADLLDYCWTCESPRVIQTKKINKNDRELIIGSCGTCDPCKKIQDHIPLDSLPIYKRIEHRKERSIIINTYKKSRKDSI